MQTQKNHWPSISILIVLALSGVFVFLFSVGLGVSSLVDLFKDSGDPAGEMIGAFAFGFELLVLFFCIWVMAQKALGYKQSDLQFKFPFGIWQAFAVIGIVVSSVTIGGLIAYTEIAWFTWIALPVLTVCVIAPPLWLLFGIGTNGIELGPRWRVFGILGLSMTMGPLIMIVLEFVLLIGIFVVGSIVVAIQQPALLQELINIGNIIKQEANPDQVINLLGPYIASPVVIATVVGYIAVLVPLIEELLKPLAVWLFAKKIESPAQGFAMGLLSGAAFALIESLNASGDGTMGWPVVVSIRAGTGLLHMTASGLVGWGIVSAFREKRFMRLFAAYFSAVAIHGIWNACAIGIGLSTIGESIEMPVWLSNFTPAMLCGMLTLGIGMFAVLIAANRKLKNSSLHLLKYN